jgi:beta-fructofuranosidase
MRHSRRNFLRAAAASASLAALPRVTRADCSFFEHDALPAKLAGDPLRPQFHLLPAKNWMNDPNGPIYWNGKYHMFFQYNPNAAVWGDMHWNHAVSDDMIHWKHLPIALAPTPDWADADGCFTGSAVNDNGVATILYTGVQAVPKERATLRDGNHNYRETQCLATSRDPKLLKWEKWREPVIQPPNDEKLTGFRDPFLWRDEASKLWYLGVASGQYKIGGRVLLYRSKDLRNWEYLHPLASGKWREKENTNPVDSGEMWECPDFFPLGKKHVLLYSTAGSVFWEVGELDPKELVFYPQKRGILDHGAYYAQKTQLDAKGNRILWGWITEKRPDSELIAAGWAGCMALPRVLTIGTNDDLVMQFAPQAESLRGSAQLRSGPTVHDFAAMDSWHDVRIKDLCGEVTWSAFSPHRPYVFADDNAPWLTVHLTQENSGQAKLVVNGISAEIATTSQSLYGFRLLFDGSVAELLCNNRHAITTRIYRQPKGPLRLHLADPNGAFSTLQAWQLRPISQDRLTS